jgi:creatinine amidohydrolase/Fe(II)-dependent formamide hydrolase-like protein
MQGIMKTAVLMFALLAMSSTSSTAEAQIRKLAEMNTEQIKALDKEKTVVILTGGIVEEHGPYLPVFSDGYWSERVAQDVAAGIVKRPGWTVVMFPTIPLGTGGANEIGGQFSYPGTFAVRFETERAVFMDLAGELGEQGFKWVFIVHGHGAPHHTSALDQASEFFNETYGGTMVNLTGLRSVMSAWNGPKTKAEQVEETGVQHANLDETSAMLALRPDLVAPGYKRAKPIPGYKIEELAAQASKLDWPGYFGSPRFASAKRYASGYGNAAREAVKAALSILDGADIKTLQRFGDLNPVGDSVNDPAFLNDAKIKARQEAWLRKKGIR